jgi:uncharacterized protein (TIGR00106 family)
MGADLSAEKNSLSASFSGAVFYWRDFMEKINLSLQIIPIIEDEERLYSTIDKVIERIKKSGYKYEVGPMETTIEGDMDGLLQIVKDAQEICLEEGANRIASIVKIDYKRDGIEMDEKTKKHRG